MTLHHCIVKRLTLVVCIAGGLTALPLAGQSQERLIQGRVVDGSTDQPIVGAQVLIAGTEIGMLTDQTGTFRLAVPASAPAQVSLEVTRIGYRPVTEQVSVGARDIRLAMVETALQLDRIVVTGTVGGTLKRSLGHSMATISASEVTENVAVPDLARLLDGRAAGVVVLQSTGMAGSGPRINIRGTSSLSLSGQPLIYVDGIRVNNDASSGPEVQGFGSAVISRLNDISPEDIESIEIIKGPAAATLYGTEAANGLIQIITKRGRAGSTTFDVRIRQGAQWLHNIAERTPTNFERDADGVLQTLNLTKQLYDQGNPPFRTAHVQGYGMSVRGGAGDVGYYGALSIDDDEGVEPNNVARRYNGRLNLSFRPHSSLNVAANIGVTTGRIDLSRETSTWSSLVTARPTLEVQTNRPPDVLRRAFRDFQEYRRLTTGVTLSHAPTDWFSQRLIVGRDFTDEDDQSITERMGADLLQWYTGAITLGSKSRQQRTISVATVDYSGSVTFPLTEGLSSQTSLGTQYYNNRAERISASGREFPAGGIDVLSAAGVTFGSDDFVENSTLGVYVQEQLGWRNRLFITGAVRVDNNSAFGDDFEFATYPKAAATWVVSEEDFWDLAWVDALRLRASYGQSGQQPADFAALRSYRPIPTGDGGSAVSPQFIGNPELAPERGSEVELGFEAGLLNERVGLDFTYYNSRTSDGILRQEMSPSSGFAGIRFLNVAEIAKQGIELAVNTRLLDRSRLGWDLNLNMSWNESEVLDLGDVNELPLAGGSVSGTSFHRVGDPVGSWYWYEIVSAEIGSDGVARNVMCDGGPAANHEPVPCAQAPKLFQGRPDPRFEGSVSSDLRLFDNLRLHTMLDFKTGFYGYDFSNFHRCRSNRLCLEAHDPTSPDVDPLRVAMLQDPVLQLGWGISDMSFAKLREVSLNYSVPEPWLRGTGTDRAVVMLSARNLYTWTGWSGLDPENTFHEYESDPLHGRYEWRNTPQPLQVVTTIRFTF